jgi:hypothetical protein
MRVVATHLGLRAAERTAQVQRLLRCFDTAEIPVILMGQPFVDPSFRRPVIKGLADGKPVLVLCSDTGM